MSAADLLSDLRGRGATLAIRGDRLRCRAPKGVLTPELRQALEAHKVELMAEIEVEMSGADLDRADVELAAMNAGLVGLYEVADRAAADQFHAEVREFVERVWLPAKCRYARALDRVGRLPENDRAWLDVTAEPSEPPRLEPDPQGGWRLTSWAEERCIYCSELLAPGDRLFCRDHGDAQRRRFPDYPGPKDAAMSEANQ